MIVIRQNYIGKRQSDMRGRQEFLSLDGNAIDALASIKT